MHTSAYQCTPLRKRALTVLLGIDTDTDIDIDIDIDIDTDTDTDLRVVVKIVARDVYLADKTFQVIARDTAGSY